MGGGFESIAGYVDAHAGEAAAFLSELVRQQSVQGREEGAQALVAERLKSLGLAADVWVPDSQALARHPYFVSSRSAFKGSPNVVGILHGTGGGRSLILNGHIDVVPEGDRAGWTRDPFSGLIEQGRVHGRGTSDMKGGLVSLLMALEAVIKTGASLRGDVVFQSVVEEEAGGAGTLAALLRGYRADAALIPEPTDMRLFIKQQGSMWFRAVVTGKSAHGGARYEGVSAIEKAHELHQAILRLETQRNSRIHDPLYSRIPIPVPINIGTIHGGAWPSSVPDRVTLEGRMGVAPEESLESAKRELTDCLRDFSVRDEWLKDHPVRLEFFGAQWLPNAVEAGHPFAKILSSSFEDVYGRPVTVEASPWGTDGGLLGKVGGISTLVMGPGIARTAHHPDEYIEVSEMAAAAKVFASLIVQWCETA